MNEYVYNIVYTVYICVGVSIEGMYMYVKVCQGMYECMCIARVLALAAKDLPKATR